jgi:micrococcal nuclease
MIKNELINRSIRRKAFCIGLITLILAVETILQLQSHLVYQQSFELIENAFASSSDSIPADNFDGIIISVIDGDTLDIRTNNGAVMTIRLALVDAPETDELGYTKAKGFVSHTCLDNPATIDPDNNQGLSYGRLVALVYCKGLNINEAIIASGFAKIYQSFCGTSEFGNSDWAQKYGCDGRDIDLSDSRISDENGKINDDDAKQEISNNCDPAYSGVCIPSPPPDLDCDDIPNKNFKINSSDPHDFDDDSDGIGCET